MTELQRLFCTSLATRSDFIQVHRIPLSLSSASLNSHFQVPRQCEQHPVEYTHYRSIRLSIHSSAVIIKFTINYSLHSHFHSRTRHTLSENCKNRITQSEVRLINSLARKATSLVKTTRTVRLQTLDSPKLQLTISSKLNSVSVAYSQFAQDTTSSLLQHAHNRTRSPSLIIARHSHYC